MKNPSSLYHEQQAKITALIETSYQDPPAFANFAKEIAKLGIVRFTFDAIKDEMSFYTKDQFVHSILRKDLQTARENSSWALGEKLDTAKLEKDIKCLDEGKLDNVEFHRQLYASGVVFCVVYLSLGQIYYLSQDGQYYLEKY